MAELVKVKDLAEISQQSICCSYKPYCRGIIKGGSVIDRFFFFRCALQTIWRKQSAFTWISQFWKLLSAMFVPFIMVTELSGVQFGLKSYVWFQNQVSTQCEFNLKSQVWFQTKIAQYKVQLPLYYIHFEIAQVQDLVSSNILLMQYWASLKLNSSIFGGEKRKFSKQWLQNLPHDTLCLSFSCNYIGYFKQALESDWLFCFQCSLIIGCENEAI